MVHKLTDEEKIALGLDPTQEVTFVSQMDDEHWESYNERQELLHAQITSFLGWSWDKPKPTEAELFEAFLKIETHSPEVKWCYDMVDLYNEINEGNIEPTKEKIYEIEKSAFDLYIENYRAKKRLKELLGG